MPTSSLMDEWDLPSAFGTLGLRPRPGRPSCLRCSRTNSSTREPRVAWWM